MVECLLQLHRHHGLLCNQFGQPNSIPDWTTSVSGGSTNSRAVVAADNSFLLRGGDTDVTKGVVTVQPAKVVAGHRSGTAAAASAAEAKRAAAQEAERQGAARALAVGQQRRCGECENCHQQHQVNA